MINWVNAGSIITLGELRKCVGRDELTDLNDLKESIITIISCYLFEGLITEDLFKEYSYFLEMLVHESKVLLENDNYTEFENEQIENY